MQSAQVMHSICWPLRCRCPWGNFRRPCSRWQSRGPTVGTGCDVAADAQLRARRASTGICPCPARCLRAASAARPPPCCGGDVVLAAALTAPFAVATVIVRGPSSGRLGMRGQGAHVDADLARGRATARGSSAGEDRHRRCRRRDAPLQRDEIARQLWAHRRSKKTRSPSVARP